MSKTQHIEIALISAKQPKGKINAILTVNGLDISRRLNA